MKKIFTMNHLLFAGLLAFSGADINAQTTFNYTGTVQTYTVPVGVTSIRLEAWGAQGQGGNGGLGGYVKGDMTVTPGQVLNIYVGGQAGFNGGGLGHAVTPRNGGGASDVRVSPYSLADRVIVAGAGGAGGPTDVGIRNGGTGGGGTVGSNYAGGGGGDGYGGNGLPGGLNGGAGNTSCHSGGGGGGGLNSGGGQSCNTCYTSTCGSPGTLGQGGDGDTWENGICYSTYGGTNGGGGGYYGGGGTSVGNCGGGGGGGGSSWGGTLANLVFTGGIRNGDGQIVITVLSGVLITQSTQILCNGQSTASLTATPSGGTPPYTYSWAPSGGTAATATGLGAGTYTVTVTDAAMNVITNSFTITQPSALSIVGTQSNILCNGSASGMAAVSVTGGTPGYTYSWTPSGGTASTASGLTAGGYTCSITDANACPTNYTFNITQPTPLTGSGTTTSPVLCNGGSATISVNASGGTSPYTGTGSFTVTAGTYTYTLTDANGCTTVTSVTVTEPGVLAATNIPSSPSGCNGTDGSINLTVTGGTSAYTFLWSNGATTEDLSSVTSGTYSCTITDANGCTATQSATLTDPNPPTVTFSLSTAIVCADDGNITLTGGSPSGGTYSGTSVTAGVFDPSPAVIGANVITYTYTDPNTNCTSSDTAVINVDACLGLQNASDGTFNFAVVPNPNNGIFVLQINTTQSVEIKVYDALGQLVSTQHLVSGGNTDMKISAPGVYLVNVTTADGQSQTQRVSVTK